jgi:hypothetical protein
MSKVMGACSQIPVQTREGKMKNKIHLLCPELGSLNAHRCESEQFIMLTGSTPENCAVLHYGRSLPGLPMTSELANGTVFSFLD